MTRFLLLAAFPAALWAQEAKPSIYTVVVTDSVRQLCRQLGVPEPAARLVLNSDSSFTYTADGLRQSRGRYAIGEAGLALHFEDAAMPIAIARLDGERISLNGLEFRKLETAFRPGEWTLRRNGIEDRSIRLTFDKSGRFSYVGMGCSSKGKWQIESGELILTWTEIDGAPPEAGLVVRKRIPLVEGADVLMVDSYRYEPASAR